MKKIMVMEGAGIGKTDHSGDVGNCRLITYFKISKNKGVYLEVTSTLDDKIHVNHCYVIDEKLRDSITEEERKEIYADGYISWRETWKKRQPYIEGLPGIAWSKAGILQLINKNFTPNFTQLYVSNYGEYNARPGEDGYYNKMEDCFAVFNYDGISLDSSSYRAVTKQIFKEQVWFSDTDCYYFIWMFPMEVHPAYPNHKKTINVWVDVQTYTDSVGPNELNVEIVERRKRCSNEIILL